MNFRLFRKKNISFDWIDKAKEDTINFNQVFSAIGERNETEALYKDLSKSLHPDRFIGDEAKQRWAACEFKLLQNNRFNLQKLKEIRDVISEKISHDL